MSSPIDTLAPGVTLLQFRLGERIGTSVWRADDTRSGKQVAIKILTRQLPRDPAKREALIREVRQGAALYHAALINILEVVPAGDNLLLVMDLVTGYTLTDFVHKGIPDRADFFRIAYQLVDAVKLLHAKNLVHGNLSGDSILITPARQVKVAGLNIANFLPRREGQSAFQQRGSDARAVSYMAPEQISGTPVDARTDIWSLGVLLYAMATGRLPFVAASANEIAHKIVNEQPASPKSVNANIDPAILSILGKCLFKDPYRRYPAVKQMLDDIAKADPEAVKFANDLARSGVAAAVASNATVRKSLLFIGEVAADAPAKDAARMQQLLGEAVFLFDGQILDPFGPRMVAEMPSVDNALEAARKGEFDFSPEQQGSEAIDVRMLLHYGDVTTRDGAVVGASIDKAGEILSQIPPGKLLITEAFAKEAKNANVRLRDAGAKAGIKLFAIVDPEPQMPAEPTPSTEELERQAAEEAAAIAAAEAAARKQQRMRMAMAAMFVIVVVGAGGAFWWSQHAKNASAPVVKAAAPKPATPTVFVQITSDDPTLADRAKAVHDATTEILRDFPEIRVADAAAPGVTSFSEKLMPPGDATVVQTVVQKVAAQLHLPQRFTTTPETLNAFVDAVGTSDKAKTEAAIRTAVKSDPKFLPAQLVAMRFFDANGKDDDAVAAAKQIVELQPDNVVALRRVARAGLKSGDVGGAIVAYGGILKQQPDDAESLNTIAKYALAAGDNAKFTAALKRLKRVPAKDVAVHDPDALLAGAHFEQAANKYYDIEEKVPTNAALSLKIGRIAVLRHSGPIADLELKKLEDVDPVYGAHMLKAYIGAASQSRPTADEELKSALAASTPGDDYWTSAAEVAALFGDNKAVIAALENAAKRKEPTASYVLADPLFAYLQSDARFVKVRAQIAATQGEIRSALASVSL